MIDCVMSCAHTNLQSREPGMWKQRILEQLPQKCILFVINPSMNAEVADPDNCFHFLFCISAGNIRRSEAEKIIPNAVLSFLFLFRGLEFSNKEKQRIKQDGLYSLSQLRRVTVWSHTSSKVGRGLMQSDQWFKSHSRWKIKKHLVQKR